MGVRVREAFPARVQIVAEMFCAGEPTKAIAEKLGVSDSRVRQIYQTTEFRMLATELLCAANARNIRKLQQAAGLGLDWARKALRGELSDSERNRQAETALKVVADWYRNIERLARTRRSKESVLRQFREAKVATVESVRRARQLGPPFKANGD